MVVLNIISTSKNSAISLHNLHSKLLFVLWDKRGMELVLKGDRICFMSNCLCRYLDLLKAYTVICYKTARITPSCNCSGDDKLPV